MNKKKYTQAELHCSKGAMVSLILIFYMAAHGSDNIHISARTFIDNILGINRFKQPNRILKWFFFELCGYIRYPISDPIRNPL
ncbi:hypothetical protein Ahy_B05g078770 isoform B [Arachis hypogaea]|uniref:Uncharacterized protein n=1 Tax=Arachis hypogaea TaxID=3818 RepID=A0A444Z7Y2_ARAHY|nr:hypothetical protein Ahy_B05g078770 isoform B [Arachis hypogaea]